MCWVQSGLVGPLVTCSCGALVLARPAIAASAGIAGTAQAFTPCLGHRPLGVQPVPVHSALELQSLLTWASLQGPDGEVTRTLELGVWGRAHPGEREVTLSSQTLLSVS